MTPMYLHFIRSLTWLKNSLKAWSEIFTMAAAFSFYFYFWFNTRYLPKRGHRENITEEVAHRKVLWENNNCIGCHTLLGEGAYYAPELGNVFNRRGGGN